MAEEQKQDQGTTEPTPPEGGASGDGQDIADLVRKHPLFLDSQRRGQEAKERLDAIEKSMADDKAAKEEADLLAKGEFEKINKKLKEDMERMSSNYSAELLRRDLSQAIMAEGATNPVFIRGAVAAFSGTAEEVTAYVDGLKGDDSNAAFFGQAQPTGQKPPVHGQPGARSTSKGLEERLRYHDPKDPKGSERIRKEARAEKAAAGGYS
jgi:hypothetical protein